MPRLSGLSAGLIGVVDLTKTKHEAVHLNLRRDLQFTLSRFCQDPSCHSSLGATEEEAN
jgi:hypothetical protein